MSAYATACARVIEREDSPHSAFGDTEIADRRQGQGDSEAVYFSSAGKKSTQISVPTCNKRGTELLGLAPSSLHLALAPRARCHKWTSGVGARKVAEHTKALGNLGRVGRAGKAAAGVCVCVY